MDKDMLRKALEGRRAKIAAGAHFRRDYLDADFWAELATSKRIRLPMWHIPPKPRALKKWFGKLRSGEVFEHVYGCSPSRLIELNPNMPLRAFVGQMLE